MNHDPHEQPDLESPASTNPHSDNKHNDRAKISAEQRQQIVNLRKAGYGMRKIAVRVGCDRKSVRKVLQKEGLSQAPPPLSRQSTLSKLDGFKETVQELAEKGMNSAPTDGGLLFRRHVIHQRLHRLREPFVLNWHPDGDVVVIGAPPWDGVSHPVSDTEGAFKCKFFLHNTLCRPPQPCALDGGLQASAQR